MASKGKAPAKASSTRVHGSTSQQQPSLEIRLYETPAHEERGKILEERKALHECTIKFPEGEDTFEERILARDWEFMYEPSIPINLSWFRGKCGYSEISEAYNNETLNMDKVLRVIGKEEATWHETTLSMEVVLLIYDLMRDMPVCLASVMRCAMNADPTKS
ncbi:hypothetical protein PIB30_079887 [Stylosanthes scabra]|uniref:Uncharacterized protein n=1 Tax=Stylosanthes scabra TaxID=79078 RepID=A0ABU6XRA6_9FABA|nr:hypothetical protein [Stylosanthes scabra]